MNKIFKVVWSASKQCYVVASELATNTSGKKKIIVATVLAALAMGGDPYKLGGLKQSLRQIRLML